MILSGEYRIFPMDFTNVKYWEKYQSSIFLSKNWCENCFNLALIFSTLMKNKKISQNQRNSVKMSLKNYIEINTDPICPKKLVSDV